MSRAFSKGKDFYDRCVSRQPPNKRDGGFPDLLNVCRKMLRGAYKGAGGTIAFTCGTLTELPSKFRKPGVVAVDISFTCFIGI